MTNEKRSQLESDIFNLHHKKSEYRVKRTNKKPENDFKNVFMLYLKRHGFSCDVVESKAVFNVQANRFIKGQAVKGFPDVVGVTPQGVGCFIELKAPGKRSSVSTAQGEFLKNKIMHNAFGYVADDIELFKKTYDEWLARYSEDKMAAQLYLWDRMPKSILLSLGLLY